MISTLFLVTIGSIFLLRAVKWCLKQGEIRKITDRMPGLTNTYRIIGDVPEFFLGPDKLFTQFREFAQRYYPVYKFRFFHVPIINIICPEDAEIVLTSTKNISKGDVYSTLTPWLGTGLLTSTGSKWQRRRKILTPSFHFNILQQFLAIFSEESDRLVEQLKQECDKPQTDLVPIITSTTLNTICETAMGTRLEKTDKASTKYVRAIYSMGEIIIHRLIHPWLTLNWLFTLTPTYWKQRHTLRTLHRFSGSVIQNRMRTFKEADLNRNDFNQKRRLAMLDLLISAKNAGAPIDDEGIREEVDTFMFEGHDTTTACICFTLMALANHSDVQEKVVQELKQLFGDSERSPTMQDLQGMHYLEQVLKESLRMYPSVPLISRIVQEEFQTHSGYTVPTRSVLVLHIFDLHYNPRVFPEPKQFDPERFSPENTQKRHPFAYVPFSAGPRNCIGQKFAMLEIKTIISGILRNFVLEAVDKQEDMDFVCHLILKSKDGVRIKFKKRVF